MSNVQYYTIYRRTTLMQLGFWTSILTVVSFHCLKSRTLDPLVFGHYPHEMRQILGSELPWFSHRQRELVQGSVNFTGIYLYSTLYVKDSPILMAFQ
jgi:hypothetical protein